ncbi:MAG: endonuclease domain-containing protein [Pseudomonadota bacterium]
MPRPRLGRDVERAKQLRAAMSLPERLLWSRLRKSPGGVRFRRQHPVGTFVLDFYCPALRLGIEIDGLAHDMGDHPEQDLMRDAWLRKQGYSIVRIPATEVLKNPDEVAEAIVTLCGRKERAPPSA